MNVPKPVPKTVPKIVLKIVAKHLSKPLQKYLPESFRFPLKNLLLNAQSIMIRDIQERRSQLSSVQEVDASVGL